jgi:predicted GH43/DUF377 family glycosyl hydrolase
VRSDKPIYSPRADFEQAGCEDPRIVEIEERIYMTYTAYDGHTPRVAISSISTKEFLARKWKGWTVPHVITPENVANKDACIIPELVLGKHMILHRVGESICAYLFDSLDFSKEKVDKCIEIISPRRGMWDGNKVGIAAPPIKTKEGWLLLYHGVSWSGTYRVGAVLLDTKNPTTVISRLAVPLFEPEEDYEKKGIVNNVVFPCGLIYRKGTLYMYYGGGDFVTAVATFSLKEILKRLTA